MHKRSVKWLWAVTACLLFSMNSTAPAVDFIYVGYNTVDMRIPRDTIYTESLPGKPILPDAYHSGSSTPPQYYLNIYRYGQMVHTSDVFTDHNYYFADTDVVKNQTYVYTIERYFRNEATDWEWVHGGISQPWTTDTWRCVGALHNAEDNIFNRRPITWSGTIHNGGVSVQSGTLKILAGATVKMDSGLGLTTNSILQAENVTFRGNTTSILHRVAVNAQYSLIRNCTFDNAELYLGNSSRNIQVVNNVFDGTHNLRLAGTNAFCSGNTGMRRLECIGHGHQVVNNHTPVHLEISGTHHHFENNSAEYITARLGGNHHFIANTTPSFDITTAQGSVIHSNLFESSEFGQYNRTMSLASNDNDVRYNIIKGGGAVVSGNDNTIADNHFTAVTGSNTNSIEVSGSNNLIYNNYFSAWEGGNGGRDTGVGNQWSIPKTAGRNIVGGAYLGGNYWARYTGTDTDGDGLGNTPHPVPGTAGTHDQLPLIGPGEIFLFPGPNHPQGKPVTPLGQPFAVAQILLRADSRTEIATISSMTFLFHGDTNRLAAIEGAGLFAGATPSLINLRPVGMAAFQGNQVTFDMNETLVADEARYYTLAYKFRYEDEYSTAGPTGTPSTNEIVIGAAITAIDITAAPAQVAGSVPPGWIKPGAPRFVSAFNADLAAAFGRGIETTGEIIFNWSLYQQICAAPEPGIFLSTLIGDQTGYLWIKDSSKVHAFSSYANRPFFRVLNCAGATQEGGSLPVSEVLDAYLANGRLFWARGLGYADPYACSDWLFAGDVDLHVTAGTGNYKGFREHILAPLRGGFGGNDKVIVDYFKSVNEGYYGKVRILTRRSTQHVLATLAGNPDVLEMRGRTLMVNYRDSSGDNPAPREQIKELGVPGGRNINADYDGDGLIDPAVYDEITGTWTVWLSSRDYTIITVSGMGGGDAIPVPADYDGDGKTDPAVYNQVSGEWTVWLSSRDYRQFSLGGTGGVNAVPVPADYDGDGLIDPAVYDASTGTWTLWLSSRDYTIITAGGMGGGNAVPVPADYDGDDRTDPAVYHPLTGTWVIWLSSDNYRGINVHGYGGTEYVPVPADYDGDGKADPAVYHPASGSRRAWLSSLNYVPVDL